MSRYWCSFSILCALSLLGCRKDAPRERGDAPPPVASSRPGLCSSGGGTVKDAPSVAFFPRSAASYCLDPNGEARSYGKEAKGTIDQVCTELFDGECEVYKSFGLERVVTVRYVDGAGSPGTIVVNLSRFESQRGALGFYSKRVVGDSDPADASTQPLKAGTMAAIGGSIAYVWRGPYVAELSYANENESPDALKASGKSVLPALASAIGESLPGERNPLPEVALLPETNRLPLGVSFESKDLLGIDGVGPGAVGYYKEGEHRYRVLASRKADEASATDVMKTLRKLPGAKELKAPAGAVSFSSRAGAEGPRVEWLALRQGGVIVAIGDEELVLAGDAKAAAARCLSFESKVEHLTKFLAATNAASTKTQEPSSR